MGWAVWVRLENVLQIGGQVTSTRRHQRQIVSLLRNRSQLQGVVCVFKQKPSDQAYWHTCGARPSVRLPFIILIDRQYSTAGGGLGVGMGDLAISLNPLRYGPIVLVCAGVCVVSRKFRPKFHRSPADT